MKTQKIICKCGCGKQKEVREADIKRGWGKFYSKSCKARYQARKNKIRTYHGVEVDNSFVGITDQEHSEIMDSLEQSWDSHKDWL